MKLSHYLIEQGFKNSNTNTLIMVYHIEKDVIIFLIYADDILVIGNNNSLIQTMISKLNNVFYLKDLGDMSLFLGLEVAKVVYGLHLSQCKYIE